MNIRSCTIAEFEGYVDDATTDPRLEADMEKWQQEHPEYHVWHQFIEPYGSSGYPLFGYIFYTEHSMGRQFIRETHQGGGERVYKLRNLKTGARIRLSVLDIIGGSLAGHLSITVQDEDHNNFVIVEKTEERRPFNG